MRPLQRITRASEAEALPVGSIIAEIGEPDAPSTACKAGRGDWQYLGDDPLRRYWSAEIFPANDQPVRNLTIVVLWRPEWARNPPSYDRRRQNP